MSERWTDVCAWNATCGHGPPHFLAVQFFKKPSKVQVDANGTFLGRPFSLFLSGKYIFFERVWEISRILRLPRNHIIRQYHQGRGGA